jgi:LacI family transcriptional regulator
LPAVIGDNVAGAYDMVKYLLNMGHRNIIYLFSSGMLKSANAIANTERLEGWQKAMTEAGEGASDSSIWDWDDASGHNGNHIESLLRKRRPTAVLCFNDCLAAELMKLLGKIHISVPGDISVAGFDDTPIANLVSLTTVAVPKKEIGSVGVKKLVNLVRGTDFGPKIVILPTEIIIRGSTASPA